MPIDNQAVIYVDGNNRDVALLFPYINIWVTLKRLKLKHLQVPIKCVVPYE